ENGDGQRVFEPREPVRGDLARALTYWLLHYRGQSSNSFIEAQIDFFRAWNKADPVTAAERQRDERIEAVQSNHNPFVACPFFVDSALDVLEP
ncbi:MAG: endonuclease, partial [Myxococcota bacterium]